MRRLRRPRIAPRDDDGHLVVNVPTIAWATAASLVAVALALALVVAIGALRASLYRQTDVCAAHQFQRSPAGHRVSSVSPETDYGCVAGEPAFRPVDAARGP